MSVVLRRLTFGIAALTSFWLSGCGTPVNRAPVENKGTYAAGPAPAGTPAPSSSAAAEQPLAGEARPLPGVENEGRPGYYTVRPGDTLIRIGLETGQYWKDLAQWNQLENPNLLYIGQVVRVVPPVEGTAVASLPAQTETGVVATPVANSPPLPNKTTPSPAPPAAKKPAAGEEKPAKASPPASSSDGILFAWPASGPILSKFHADLNKGLDIGGNAGDPVMSAADGRVVYAGSQLRGYGNLIIVKHNDTYLTAYAHNQKLLVKEEQNVRRGQKIAEIGKSDSDRVKLHFEIRRKGIPIDPMQFLPKR